MEKDIGSLSAVKPQSEIQSQVVCEKDAAIYIGMSRSFLRQDRVDGPHGNRTPGPPFIRVGRRILYRRFELDNWLEKHLVRRWEKK